MSATATRPPGVTPSRPQRTRGLSLRTKRGLAIIPLYVPIVIAAFFFVLPLFWMALGAFKTPSEAVSFPPALVPTGGVSNFADVFNAIPFLRYFLNSAVIAVLSTAGAVFSASLAGYAFARLRSRASRPLFVVVLGTLMVPPYILIIPTFSLYQSLGWLNTYLPMTVPSFLGVGTGLYIFLMRQFFLGIPADLIDAAKVDGASVFRTFFTVALPLARPAIITVALFQFVASWNDFFTPLVYLTDSQLYTLPVATRLFQGLYSTSFGPLMAMSTLSILPVVVLFLISQRFFVQGIATTGLTG